MQVGGNAEKGGLARPYVQKEEETATTGNPWVS